MFTQEDLLLLQEKGISEQQIATQLSHFKKGFPFLKIIGAASTQNGILSVSEADKEEYLKIWQEYLNTDKQVTKFVPSSGAASRMFKDLYSFLDAAYDAPTTDFEKKFFDNITHFAFYDTLSETCRKIFGKSAKELMNEGNYKAVIEGLLSEEGLNYGNMPKGLLLFHHYKEGNKPLWASI